MHACMPTGSRLQGGELTRAQLLVEFASSYINAGLLLQICMFNCKKQTWASTGELDNIFESLAQPVVAILISQLSRAAYLALFQQLVDRQQSHLRQWCGRCRYAALEQTALHLWTQGW